MILYCVVGVVVGFCYGVNRAWSVKDDGAEDLDAIFFGGAYFLATAILWPLVLPAHLVGFIGVKAYEKWTSEVNAAKNGPQ